MDALNESELIQDLLVDQITHLWVAFTSEVFELNT